MVERTSEGQRVDFYRRYLRGETYSEIAQACNVSRECVRYWCRKQKKGQGVKSQWHIPKRGALSRFDAEVVKQIKQLREENRCWGPNSLRMHLEDEPALKGKFLPSPASIGRWLHEDPANRRHPKSIQPSPPFLSLQFVHQRWQIDAVEKICLRAGQFASVLDIREPVGALMIGSRAFRTTKRVGQTWRKLTLNEVRHSLRLAFASWGMPAEIQTDNESLFVGIDKADFPTVFTLWLVGLGIGHHLSLAQLLRGDADGAELHLAFREARQLVRLDVRPEPVAVGVGVCLGALKVRLDAVDVDDDARRLEV